MSKDDLKDFLDFYQSDEKVETLLSQEMKKEIQMNFHAKKIWLRVGVTFILGGMISLLFCPQFGFGFFSGHGLAHYFMRYGEWACAAFCGGFFFSFGWLLCLISLPEDQLWWIWRTGRWFLSFIPVSLWGLFMFFGKSFDLPQTFEGSAHIAWIASALVGQYLFLKLAQMVRVHHFAK